MTNPEEHEQNPPAPLERILALDVGNRRIGLAISDPLGFTAQPLFTLHRSTVRADLKSLGRVIRKHAITDLVVGNPLHLSGELSPQAVKTQRFTDELRLQHPGLRFHLLDERLTTAEAHHLLDRSGGSGLRARSAQGRRDRSQIIDQVAAVVLLESFLSARSPRLLPPPPEL